jgi:hypothetical protein
MKIESSPIVRMKKKTAVESSSIVRTVIESSPFVRMKKTKAVESSPFEEDKG